MNDTNKEAGNDAYEGPLSPAGVAALKFAVVGMGVLIIVGEGCESERGIAVQVIGVVIDIIIVVVG